MPAFFCEETTFTASGSRAQNETPDTHGLKLSDDISEELISDFQQVVPLWFNLDHANKADMNHIPDVEQQPVVGSHHHEVVSPSM